MSFSSSSGSSLGRLLLLQVLLVLACFSAAQLAEAACTTTFTQQQRRNLGLYDPDVERAFEERERELNGGPLFGQPHVLNRSSLHMNVRRIPCSRPIDCPVPFSPCEVVSCQSCVCSYRNAAEGTLCDDGIFCNGDDTCDASGTCAPSGAKPRCGTAQCNTFCNETAQNCFNAFGTTCNDGLWCTGTDRCDGLGGCKIHTGNPCVGGAVCRTFCNETLDNCFNPPTTPCDNGLFCDGTEVCNGAGTCVSSGNPCTGAPVCNNTCNENANNCLTAVDTTCTTDDNVCTTDTCSGTGTCRHTPNTLLCTDGNTCTAGDQCNGGACISGTNQCTCNSNLDCNDGNNCTIDTCVATTGINSCRNTPVPVDTVCDDGLFCNGADFCQISGPTTLCTGHIGDPCAAGTVCNNICNEALNSCRAPQDYPCPNSIFCDGAEVCKSGVCTSPGDPCGSGPICNNKCNEAADSCHSPLGVNCSNGLFCDGYETCDGLGVCTPSSDPCRSGTTVCDSTCDEVQDKCAVADGTPCNDNVWCNGQDICLSGVCIHLDPTAPCTILSKAANNSCLMGCNETSRECLSEFGAAVTCLDTLNRSDCDDARFCNGREVCDGRGGVFSTGSPCATTCDEAASACASANDAANEDTSATLGALDPMILGGIGVALLLCCCCLVVGLVVFVHRRREKTHLPNSVEMGEPTSASRTPHNHYESVDTRRSPGSALSYGAISIPSYASAISTPSMSAQIPQALADMIAASSLAQAPGNWKIPFDEITVERQIGAGAFGTVYAGVWRGGKVAIKTIQGDDFSQQDLDNFLAEAQVMQSLRPHANVVQFFGVSFGSLGVCILVEFMKRGALDSIIFNPKTTVTPTEQLTWIRGIASGMQHLAAENVVHRDLAARNVLLGDDSVKIADFGMARHGSGSQNTTKSNTGPLKHMPFESLMKRQYSEKSDVWAFAITCVEILTRMEPYPDLDAVATAAQVTHGLRPEFPSNTNPAFLAIMQQCLQDDPTVRPTFAQLLDQVARVNGCFV